MKVIEIVQIKIAEAKTDPAPGSWLKGPLHSIFASLGIIYYIDDCMKTRKKLDRDLAQFKKLNGQVSEKNSFYGDKSIEQAQDHYYQLIREVVGKVSFSIAAVLASNAFRFFLVHLSDLIRYLPILGGPISVVVRLLAALAALGMPAALAWLEINQDTIAAMFRTIIYNVVGLPSSVLWNEAVELVNAALVKLEIKKDNSVKDRLTVPIKPNSFMSDIFKGPEGPLIAGQTATDDGVHLTIDPTFYNNPVVRDEVLAASRAGTKNPLDSIPKQPGKIYPTWDATRSQFEYPSGFIAQWNKYRAEKGI